MSGTKTGPLLGVAFSLALSLPAAAHDFWLQPEAFWAAPGAAIPVKLLVGHGPERQRSLLPARRIVRFATVAPDGAVTDQRSVLRLGEAKDDGELRLAAPGTHVVVLATDDRAESHQPAARYNAYLRDEGLTPATEARRAAHRTEAEGSESYSREAKALVQVAGAREAGAQVTRPVGLPLEIVPGVNPYAEPRPVALPVRVFWEGRPLAGALVKLTDLAHDAEPLEAHRTDAAGWARFAMPGKGDWLLNVVWTKPAPPTRDTDFETVFSSLTFGLPPVRDR